MEVNEEELALQKIREELQKEDTDSFFGCSTCDICKHPGVAEANTVYFENNKSVDVVQVWFKNKYSSNFTTKNLTTHFKEHIEPFVSSSSVMRAAKLEKLKKQSTSIKDTPNKIPMIMEILWKRISDIYVAEENDPESSSDKEEHRKSSKETVELAKAYREFYQMNIEIMGLGKTPEEQSKAVQECFGDMVDKFSEQFKDHPEVQKKFDEFLKAFK